MDVVLHTQRVAGSERSTEPGGLLLYRCGQDHRLFKLGQVLCSLWAANTSSSASQPKALEGCFQGDLHFTIWFDTCYLNPIAFIQKCQENAL